MITFWTSLLRVRAIGLENPSCFPLLVDHKANHQWSWVMCLGCLLYNQVVTCILSWRNHRCNVRLKAMRTHMVIFSSADTYTMVGRGNPKRNQLLLRLIVLSSMGVLAFQQQPWSSHCVSSNNLATARVTKKVLISCWRYG